VAVKRPSRHALFAFATVALVCCTTWGTPVPLERALLDKRPGVVRLTLSDGRRFEVEGAAIRGDTLVGDTTVYQSRERVDRYPVAIPLAQVRFASVRRISARRSVALVLGLSALVAIIVEARPNEPVTTVSPGSSGEGCAGM
jgi:hypothetical protein